MSSHGWFWRRRHTFGALAAALTAILAVTPANAGQRTDQLLWDCQGIGESKEVGRVYCIGYLSGFVDAVKIAETIFGRQIICPPANGISNDQAIRIFMKWAENNPKDMHITARSSVLFSLADAFPCAK